MVMLPLLALLRIIMNRNKAVPRYEIDKYKYYILSRLGSIHKDSSLFFHLGLDIKNMFRILKHKKRKKNKNIFGYRKNGSYIKA